MKTYQLYLLSILSGLLLSFAWFPNGFTPLIFIAFVPLLLIEKEFSISTKRFASLQLFAFSYQTFFIWNILVTWWVKNASFGGAAMAILCNALLMAIIFVLFHQTKKRIGKYTYFIFISFWLAWEYFHHHWDLTWPWLTLGNVFAGMPSIVQWYEYTGIFGGSLWVLVVNCLITEIYKNIYLSPLRKGLSTGEGGVRWQMGRRGMIYLLISTAILPIIFSLFIIEITKSSRYSDAEIVIVQPNIDPYNEKFEGGYDQQVIKMLQLAEQKITDKTEYLILPETALAENIWEEELEQSSAIRLLRTFISKYPKLKIVVGASTTKLYLAGDKLSATARKLGNTGNFYDAYNTGLQIDSTKTIQVYHKSRLVPGVEKMPFPAFFKLFEDFAIDMGGTSGSLGTQDERTVFVSNDKLFSTAPVICYESIYGEYVGEYINNGAQFISIITNDGWWGDTPGYKQHLKYGALRAIETRKWIARSANTGISCFINPKGEIIQPTQWWQPAVISSTIQLNKEITFYVRFGDYIAKAAAIFAVLFLIYSQLIRFRIVKK